MTRRKPLVSIITVCLNSEKTIARTIESVLGQTYSPIEYLVMDGASTDGTLDIVRQYERRFKGCMKIRSEKDSGLYDAMNKGIRLAKGAIIGIINSDDWYEKDAVRLVVEAYRHHGEAVFYGILRVLEDGKEVMVRAVHHESLHREVLGHPAYFVATSVYESKGGFRPEFPNAADYELMIRLVKNHVPFVLIERVLANFTEGGTSAKNAKKTLSEYLKIRHEYGYISNMERVLTLYKYKVLSFLRKVRIRI